MKPFDDYAVLVLCAGDVDQIWHNLVAPDPNPKLPPDGAPGIAYVTARYWDCLGQIRCDDLFIAKGENCYYGMLLRCIAPVGPFNIGDYLVAVRGTMDPLEWANDATAEIPEYRPDKLGGVAAGFWGVYSTITFCDLNGDNVQQNAALAIATIVNAEKNRVFVAGHSLGAALATYLASDLQMLLPDPATPLLPYFFASPRTGTSDFVANYQQAMPNYTVCNFAADLVPMLPSAPPFCILNGGGPTHDVHVIPRNTTGAPPFPQLDLAKNHNPAYYAHMLDPNNTVATALLPAP